MIAYTILLGLGLWLVGATLSVFHGRPWYEATHELAANALMFGGAIAVLTGGVAALWSLA